MHFVSFAHFFVRAHVCVCACACVCFFLQRVFKRLQTCTCALRVSPRYFGTTQVFKQQPSPAAKSCGQVLRPSPAAKSCGQLAQSNFCRSGVFCLVFVDYVVYPTVPPTVRPTTTSTTKTKYTEKIGTNKRGANNCPATKCPGKYMHSRAVSLD